MERDSILLSGPGDKPGELQRGSAQQCQTHGAQSEFNSKGTGTYVPLLLRMQGIVKRKENGDKEYHIKVVFV